MLEMNYKYIKISETCKDNFHINVQVVALTRNSTNWKDLLKIRTGDHKLSWLKLEDIIKLPTTIDSSLGLLV